MVLGVHSRNLMSRHSDYLPSRAHVLVGRSSVDGILENKRDHICYICDTQAQCCSRLHRLTKQPSEIPTLQKGG